MQRRSFLKAATAAGVVATSCTKKTASLKGSQKSFRWRLVMSVPKTLPVWGEGVVRFAKQVKDITEGRMDIRVYGANELVPAFEVFDAVGSGRVQMGHSAAYYWQGKIPAAPFFTSVPFGLNANGMRAWIKSGGGRELWDELYKPFGVKSFLAGNTGFQMGGWFRKPINSIDDYRGLKMRIPGLGGKVIEKAGAKPQVVPGAEIFTNLSTGVIDATEWVGPYHDYTMGFHKVAKHYYYPGWHETGPALELMVNRREFAALPISIQQAIEVAAAAVDRDIYAEWQAKDSEYLAKIRADSSVSIKPFPHAVLTKLRAYAEEVKQEVARSSPLARKIYASYSQFQKQFDAHQAVTEWAYIKALEK